MCNTPPHLLLDPQEFPVLAYYTGMYIVLMYCIPRLHGLNNLLAKGIVPRDLDSFNGLSIRL